MVKKKSMPGHLRRIVKKEKLTYDVPPELARRIHAMKERCKSLGLVFDLDDVLAKTAERLVNQTEEYLEGMQEEKDGNSSHLG